MQPWTCWRCERAATLGSLRGARRWPAAHPSPRPGLRAASSVSQAKAPAGRMNQAARYKLARHRAREERRAPELYQPPFLREKTRSTRFDWLPYTGKLGLGHDSTWRLKRHEAPFAAAFFANPYAHMLATPVRQCSFTKAIMPRACMLDFSDVDVDVGAAGRPDVQTHLLPLSLAAQLVSKKKNRGKLSDDEAAAVKRWAEEADTLAPPPCGPSYMVALKDAVQFVSDDRKKRLWSYAVGNRMQQMMERDGRAKRLQWRKDMPQVVLQGLRKLLKKRLGFFFQIKGQADAAGPMQAMIAGSGGLERLDELNNVACVLRLTRSSEDEPVKAPAPDRDVTQEESAPQSEAPAKGQSSSSKSARAASRSSLVGSETQNPRGGPWHPVQTKLTPFLDDLRAAGPPAKPLSLYFPTLRYRNRRIPAYSLPHLLGDEMTAELVKGTVYEGETYVALQHTRNLLAAQQDLLRLHAYLAEGKDKALKI